ncbi:MAG: right-handed parallel beta-helix repeat-containing protein [Phycisphaerales bacterium JB043]
MLKKLLLGFSLIVPSSSALAGDLTPPSGPVQETDRVTLNAQVISLPYTISSPGSYVLTSDFSSAAFANGIKIDANDVTLDLNGFSITNTGPGTSGIFVDPNVLNVTIKNGSVIDWTVGVNAAASMHVRVIGVTARGSSTGIQVGPSSLVSNCSAYDVTEGFEVYGGTLITDCTTQNASTGFTLYTGSSARDCVSESSTTGFQMDSNSSAFNCVTNNNSGRGFQFLANTSNISLQNCKSRGGNHGVLIDTTDGFTIDGLEASQSNFGIQCQGMNGVISNSTIKSTGLDGILLSGTATGIHIFGNSIHGSSTYGIRASPVAGNLITRNTVNGPTNPYDLGANNSYGPIVDLSAGGDMSTLADPNNTHPWANFEY